MLKFFLGCYFVVKKKRISSEITYTPTEVMWRRGFDGSYVHLGSRSSR